MADSTPFVDREEGELDTDQILDEAYPLIGLIALFGAIALIPLLLVFVFANTSLGVFFSIVTQLVLAVGIGIILMYIVARGIQLADG